MAKIEVDITDFNSLFAPKVKTVVPDYQRAYVWTIDKAGELLDDFLNHFLSEPTEPYYLGSILLYLNEDAANKQYEIIDGQQRIITLLMLKSIAGPSLPEYFDVSIRSQQSVAAIHKVQQVFRQRMSDIEMLKEHDFLNHLCFTRIITHSEDSAFTFFDTQNNRGIKLSSTDFLKAYHLRAIKSEQLQEQSAVAWEQVSNKSNKPDFLNFYFEKILWRARAWKGWNLEFENKSLILNTFQKATLENQDDGYVLYPSFNNRGYHYMSRLGNEPIAHSLTAFHKSALTYPLCLRQPLHKGLNFFDYTRKYTEVFEWLFENDNVPRSVLKMREYYHAIYTSDTSVYLRDFMQLCLVMFYDSFGSEQMEKSINYFDYIIGSIRLKKQQVNKEAVTIYLREKGVNLLDLLSSSFRPEDVFKYIRHQTEMDLPYAETKAEREKGVQGRYMDRMLTFFKQPANELKNRKAWLK